MLIRLRIFRELSVISVARVFPYCLIFCSSLKSSQRVFSFFIMILFSSFTLLPVANSVHQTSGVYVIVCGSIFLPQVSPCISMMSQVISLILFVTATLGFDPERHFGVSALRSNIHSLFELFNFFMQQLSYCSGQQLFHALIEFHYTSQKPCRLISDKFSSSPQYSHFKRLFPV